MPPPPESVYLHLLLRRYTVEATLIASRKLSPELAKQPWPFATGVALNHSVIQLAGGLGNPGAIARDGAVLYFATQGNASTSGGLYRLAL